MKTVFITGATRGIGEATATPGHLMINDILVMHAAQA